MIEGRGKDFRIRFERGSQHVMELGACLAGK